MAVWIAAISAILFYLTATPVKLALFLHLGERRGFGAGITPFDARRALRSAQKRSLGEAPHLPWKNMEREILRRAVYPAALQAGRYLAKRLQLDFIRANGSVCTADAAHTAMICGCAYAAESALEPLLKKRLQLQLRPDFSAGSSDVQLCSMLTARLGHIICAALIGAWHYLNLRRKISRGKAPD